MVMDYDLHELMTYKLRSKNREFFKKNVFDVKKKKQAKIIISN